MDSKALCLNCGKEFFKQNYKHKFCSSHCKSAYRYKTSPEKIGVCKKCGKEFKYKTSYNKKVYFCSKSCATSYNIPEKTLICVDCGISFKFRGRTTKLRCDACHKKYHNEQTKKAQLLANPYKMIGIGKGGGQCSEEAKNNPLREQLLASRRAYYAAHAERFRAAARKSYRNKVLTESDNCYLCGFNKWQEVLVVHHKDMNRANNESSNLVILCPNCHVYLHKQIKEDAKLNRLEELRPLIVFNNIEKILKQPNKNSGIKRENLDKTTRTEGCEESQSGAEHTGRERSSISQQEAATE